MVDLIKYALCLETGTQACAAANYASQRAAEQLVHCSYFTRTRAAARGSYTPAALRAACALSQQLPSYRTHLRVHTSSSYAAAAAIAAACAASAGGSVVISSGT